MPDCPIWKALRASTAHPELFKSAEIEELGIKLQFIGGAFGCSNPTAQMLKEASTLFPDRFVASVTSIGTGHARTIQIPQPSRPGRALPLGAVLKVAQAIATDNERVAEEMAARFSNTEGVYYRLNVNQGIQDIRACEWEKQSEVASHAGSYLQLAEVNRRLNRLVLAVQGRRATLAARLIGAIALSLSWVHALIRGADGHIHTVIQSRPAVDVSLLIGIVSPCFNQSSCIDLNFRQAYRVSFEPHHNWTQILPAGNVDVQGAQVAAREGKQILWK